MIVMDSQGRLGKILVGMNRALGESESSCFLIQATKYETDNSPIDREIRMSYVLILILFHLHPLFASRKWRNGKETTGRDADG
jgi:hypothetical protein